MPERMDVEVGMCLATLLVDPLAAGPDEVRNAGEAAAAAGCTTLSVWADHVPALTGLGLRVQVIEAAVLWATGTADQARAEADRFAGLAQSTGAPLIAAVAFGPALADLDRARDHLSHLVQTAAGVGARVCVEFLPGSAIGTLATAWDLVEPLGERAGILLDTWHWTRQQGGPNPELLACIPGDRVRYVQLSDVAPQAGEDVLVEAMQGRLLPGHGVVDYGAFFGGLDTIGAQPFFATEVFNPGIVNQLGAAGAATAMVDAARRVLG